MKVLLQNVARKDFYAPHAWVPKADAAHDFKKTAVAVEFAADRGLHDIEIVLWFDDPRYNLALPLKASRFEH